MHRLPLSDELKYEFHEPRHHPLVMPLAKRYNDRKLKHELKIRGIETFGAEPLRDLIRSGDGVMLAPNHSDHADSALMFELGRSLGRPFYFMATHSIFRGANRYLLPRIGCFPVDREGTDKRALKKAQEILAAGKSPLVVFPEGEIYRLNDTITPLREGVAAVATMAARKSAALGRTVWVVPVGIKYRFPPEIDPVPWLQRTIAELERRFEWAPAVHMPIQDRLYRYASGMLALKEIEIFGGVRSDAVRDRVANLRDHVLCRVEAEVGARASARGCTVPERVKVCRRKVLDLLESPGLEAGRFAVLKRMLDELFFVIQLYSYPGDYVINRPTCERAAEILIKFKQDALRKDIDRARHEVPRSASIRLGEPIDVRKFLQSLGGKGAEQPEGNQAEVGAVAGGSRRALGALTDLLETRIQELLDRGSPGRALPGCEHLV
jgi:hypothetical protein